MDGSGALFPGHINGIEAYWSYTKRRIAKFNGVRENFELHLKECEWRWNRNHLELASKLWGLPSLEPSDLLLSDGHILNILFFVNRSIYVLINHRIVIDPGDLRCTFDQSRRCQVCSSNDLFLTDFS